MQFKNKLSETGYLIPYGKQLPLIFGYDTKRIVLEYLKARLGFNNTTYLSEKLSTLFDSEITKKAYEAFGLKNKKDYALTEEEEYSIEYNYLTRSIITQLEYDNKRRKPISYETISASDISQFIFCPVSYSINKSFDILINKNKKIGTLLHEKTRLIKKYDQNFTQKIKIEQEGYINKLNKYFFDDLNNSTLIFSGHSSNNTREYYKNKNFVGQPDYIFKNSNNKYYVIEEKFRYIKDGDTGRFYKNHKMQVGSYIYGIKDYEIDYGYLLNWGYDYDSEGKLFIASCEVLKINRNILFREELIKVYKKIKNFNATKILEFNVFEEVLTEKCINCSVAGICNHKYRYLSKLKIPYEFSRRNIDVAIPVEIQNYIWKIDLFFNEEYPCNICNTYKHCKEMSPKYLKFIDATNGVQNYNLVNSEENNEDIIDWNINTPLDIFRGAIYLFHNVCKNCSEKLEQNHTISIKTIKNSY